MLDIGWTEIVVIAGVAIIVVGPKDLPGMLRTFGRTMGQVRRTANDFKRQFDEALREAERQSGMEETKKTLQSVSKMDPLADVKKDVEKAVNASGKGASAKSPSGKDASGKDGAEDDTKSVDEQKPVPSALAAAPATGADADAPSGGTVTPASDAGDAAPDAAPPRQRSDAPATGQRDGPKSDAA
ncbi:Sec-independent protein translocase protein TatB [Afifella pfennigii]|uniref:Sec-independent protein translocase protein TatB n=1 Tax=Afifella pfennigii TaxID=209897 RepID=UPI000691C8B0|nr:Sec-independent protein translocase protein TatB [Afifella pfennigii]